MVELETEEKRLKRMYATLCEFAQVPDEEWNKAKTKLRSLRIEKNNFFIKAGEIPDKLAYISDGIFRVYYTSESGNERILVFRGENRLLSAYSSFLENTVSSYSIQALEQCNLLYITLSDYTALLNDHPCWQTITSKYSQMLVVEKERRENEFLCDDAETRYKKFILNYPGLEKRINQYQVAAYLGITPVALSRIRSKKN
ncbi:MAG: Crp/Fnr family transcriptional regulator [Bacillota bacterium]|nr:Crp/Fnr family transcriptional regulator [Bacillota bacterium]